MPFGATTKSSIELNSRVARRVAVHSTGKFHLVRCVVRHFRTSLSHIFILFVLVIHGAAKKCQKPEDWLEAQCTNSATGFSLELSLSLSLTIFAILFLPFPFAYPSIDATWPRLTRDTAKAECKWKNRSISILYMSMRKRSAQHKCSSAFGETRNSF